MISIVGNFLDKARGQGAYSVTTPSMDGALRPNSGLDDMAVLRVVPQVDNVAATGDTLIFSAGPSLFTSRPDEPPSQPFASFNASVSALAARADGTVAVALDNGSLILTDMQGSKQRRQDSFAGGHEGSITALAFSSSGELHACIGSRHHRASAWKRDLMEKGSTGSVWRVKIDDLSADCLADGLAFPNGIAFDAKDLPLVSESWRHRIVRINRDRLVDVTLDDLPGYPGRLAPAADGGFWLCMFARRSQMVEFVLREDGYRRRMMRDIPEDHWVAPTLRSGRSQLEPLQGGAIRQLGIHKAWAPSLSYGLLVKLDAECQPVASWHSRADGQRHGITAAVEFAGQLATACKGDGVLLHMDCGEG